MLPRVVQDVCESALDRVGALDGSGEVSIRKDGSDATAPVSVQALRDPDELEQARRLRIELADMDMEAAARALSDQILATPSNAELLARL